VDPVPDPLLFFLIVAGIEPGPPDLWPRTLTARPQRRSDKLTLQFKTPFENKIMFVTMAVPDNIHLFTLQ
jgi:hypothetical protein